MPKFCPNQPISRFRQVLVVCAVAVMAAQAVFACEADHLIWQIREKTADPFYRFVQQEKAGYIDGTGRVLIKPTFDTYGHSGYMFVDGLLRVGPDAQFADITGRIIIDKDYASAWDFSDGLAAASETVHGNWGFIDRSGAFAISPRFANYPTGYVFPFSDGMAMIDAGERYGYIDRSGEYVIKPRFLFGTSFTEGRAAVVIDGPCSYFGEEPCPDVRTFGGPTREKVGSCKFAIIDKAGTILSENRFDLVKDFSEGMAAVQVAGKWGYIDTSGKVVIEPQFEEVGSFSDGVAWIRRNNLYGFITPTGKLLAAPQFTDADDFADGLAPVSTSANYDSRSYYYIDKSGKVAIKGPFVLASSFFGGLAHVKIRKPPGGEGDGAYEHGIFAYINTSGKCVFTYNADK